MSEFYDVDKVNVEDLISQKMLIYKNANYLGKYGPIELNSRDLVYQSYICYYGSVTKIEKYFAMCKGKKIYKFFIVTK